MYNDPKYLIDQSIFSHANATNHSEASMYMKRTNLGFYVIDECLQIDKKIIVILLFFKNRCISQSAFSCMRHVWRFLKVNHYLLLIVKETKIIFGWIDVLIQWIE